MLVTRSSTDWASILVAEYEAGADDEEVMAAIRLSRKDFAAYYEDNATFRELVDVGRLASAAWWKRTARLNLFNKNFNSSIWLPVMRHRFGWSDKSELNITGAPLSTKSDDELRADIAARMPGLAKKLGVVKKEADSVVLPFSSERNDE
jgi:hypothetical protein